MQADVKKQIRKVTNKERDVCDEFPTLTSKIQKTHRISKLISEAEESQKRLFKALPMELIKRGPS